MNFYPSILTSCWGSNFQYTPALYKKNGNTLPRVRMNLKIRPPRPSRLPLGAYFPIHPSSRQCIRIFLHSLQSASLLSSSSSSSQTRTWHCIDNPSIHVIGESHSCVHKSRIAIWMCDKGKYFCTLNNSVTDFYKRLYTQRGPIFPASKYRFFSSVRTQSLLTFFLGKVALTNGLSPSSLLWTLTLKRSLWNCKIKASRGKVDFSNCNDGRPLIKQILFINCRNKWYLMVLGQYKLVLLGIRATQLVHCIKFKLSRAICLFLV